MWRRRRFSLQRLGSVLGKSKIETNLCWWCMWVGKLSRLSPPQFPLFHAFPCCRWTWKYLSQHWWIFLEILNREDQQIFTWNGNINIGFKFLFAAIKISFSRTYLLFFCHENKVCLARRHEVLCEKIHYEIPLWKAARDPFRR